MWLVVAVLLDGAGSEGVPEELELPPPELLVPPEAVHDDVMPWMDDVDDDPVLNDDPCAPISVHTPPRSSMVREQRATQRNLV
jgi:hypothetical protein